MSRFYYTVYVDIPDDYKNNPQNLADQVMAERLDHDEDYGFDYTIEWAY